VARILIVDDEANFRSVLRIALAARGYDVTEAANGADALAILNADTPHLVLLDWNMDGLDGLQTCRAIRNWLNIPVIMVTSRKQSSREQALAAGANDYVTKPFELDYLMTRVESALSR
jgi:two-component system KDP operon response regulator KdpE